MQTDVFMYLLLSYNPNSANSYIVKYKLGYLIWEFIPLLRIYKIENA